MYIRYKRRQAPLWVKLIDISTFWCQQLKCGMKTPRKARCEEMYQRRQFWST